ncbi:hypothetical protein [Streptomyces iconiensis]|uniref:Uncharacterized protein n=1 Tax=Streptomyces iconiensis TaxID=1384038 RepID=A0ABT7AA28_9ACTN|nr:hypothetical protein [Streptomyces iconiensis]MDJ1138213.1 hypothetical protein [Streptomyces iconiensis]
MGQDRTLARGARVFGAALIGALALISLGWIIRDFTKANEVTDVWWNWTGRLARAEDGIWVTSYVEPTLLLLYAVAAVTVIRSSSAAGILACTGVLTALLRTPGLWNLNANWMQGIDDGLMSKVLVTTVAVVVIGVALVVTAVAGRRPVQQPGGYGYGYAPSPGLRPGGSYDPAEEPAAGPTRGGAVTAFLLLGAMAAVLAAWEIHDWQKTGWDSYQRALTGERLIVRLLDVPTSWTTWSLVLLALVAAVAALAGAPFSRPLGLVTAGPLLGIGLFFLAFALKSKLFENFGELSTQGQLRLLTGLLEIVVGAVVLAALARGEHHSPRPLPEFRDRGAPYSASPPGW